MRITLTSRGLSAQSAQTRFKSGWAVIQQHQNRSRSNACSECCAFCQSDKTKPSFDFFPGLWHGKGLHAAQLENLASNGYVVAAISHTYDAFAVLFPDGTDAVYSNKRWPAQPSFEGKANLNQLEWHADDIRFVLDQADPFE